MSKYIVFSMTVLMATACATKGKDKHISAPAAKPAAAKPAASGKDAGKAAKDAGKAAAKEAAAGKEASKAAAKESADENMTCKNGSDERTLTLTTANGGCELNYTKFGTPQQVATSGNGKEYCETVREKIKTKLEGAGFTCQ